MMKFRNQMLKPGDLVEVRSPKEIAETLDSMGTLDQLPFMPEMIGYCGKRFRVSQKVVIVCSSGTKAGSTLRSFSTDDVVLLEGLRCSGADHDGCQKACTVFWRTAWLRKVDKQAQSPKPTAGDITHLRSRLKTSIGANLYFCQASELLRATKTLSKFERYSKCFTEVTSGNCTVVEMLRRIGIFAFWKARRVLLGHYARGNSNFTPTETLNLQPGELVQVKPLDAISSTLDEKANNRGLWFSPNMRTDCNQERRVERRIEKLIVDGTGEMRRLKNTVFLENSHCGCPYIALGGCSRREFVYWREIWLRRSCKESRTECNVEPETARVN